MNILVSGANGQLGMELRNIPASDGDRFVFTDINEMPGCETVYLDITNRDAVALVCESENIDLIVNCAAYTNVDKAEDDVSTAELLNSTAPANLASVAAERGAGLIHISTDYVFGGDATSPIREDAAPDPRSVYGSTKLSGERAILRSGCKSIIIRTAWLYSPYGKNFVKTMINLTSSKPEVKVVDDQVGSPTSAADLAALIAHIIRTRQHSKCGIYHFTDEGCISWYDFACAIRDLARTSADVKPCLSSEFPSKVNRPHYSVLDKTLVRTTFGFEIPFWKDSLEVCIAKLLK